MKALHESKAISAISALTNNCLSFDLNKMNFFGQTEYEVHNYNMSGVNQQRF